MSNKFSVETTKAVYDMSKSGKSNSEIAKELDIALSIVEHILETNKDGNYINLNKTFLYDISSDLDDEIRNISGLASLLFCLGDNVSELTDDAMWTLGSHLYNIHDRLMALSGIVMDFQRESV